MSVLRVAAITDLNGNSLVQSKIVNWGTNTYNGRVSWGDASANEYWNDSYTKVQSNTYLYVELMLSMRNNYSDCLVHEARYAGGTWFQGTQPYDAGFSANSRPFYSTFFITGATTTGSNTISFRWRTANNTGGNKPAQIWNPNSSDDGRYTQEFSRWTVWEIAP